MKKEKSATKGVAEKALSVNKKKRTSQEKEASFDFIARLALAEPFLASNLNAFARLVASHANISISQAKRDIEAVQAVMRSLAEVDYKKVVSQKLLEYAYIKELALKENNLNAYLGAVKAEGELLGLKRLSFFAQEEDESKALKQLEEKKSDFLKSILEEEKKKKKK